MSNLVTFDISSIKTVVRQLDDYANKYPELVVQFMNKLALMGTSVAESSFGSGAVVTATMYEDGFVINANGEGVCFLEFGAGDLAGSGVDLGEFASIPFEVRPGSWSEQNAQQYSTQKFWEFGGVIYHSIVPRMGMYKASKVIQEKIEETAKEVFG